MLLVLMVHFSVYILGRIVLMNKNISVEAIKKYMDNPTCWQWEILESGSDKWVEVECWKAISHSIDSGWSCVRLVPHKEHTIEAVLEEIWASTKGMIPGTNEMWLTPRQEREADAIHAAWAAEDKDMKLWLLQSRTDLDKNDNPWVDNPRDCYHGFVVRATSVTHAREIADRASGAESVSHSAWLNPKYSTCEALTNTGKSGIIITDFYKG